jgi:hypothetical protein
LDGFGLVYKKSFVVERDWKSFQEKWGLKRSSSLEKKQTVISISEWTIHDDTYKLDKWHKSESEFGKKDRKKEKAKKEFVFGWLVEQKSDPELWERGLHQITSFKKNGC